jgi:hypothetical protein
LRANFKKQNLCEDEKNGNFITGFEKTIICHHAIKNLNQKAVLRGNESELTPIDAQHI